MNCHHHGNTNTSKHSIPFSPELMDGEEEGRNKVTERAERIVQRLVESRRELLSRDFYSPYLIFSEGWIVSLSHGIIEALRGVEKLLDAGSEPLGVVTAPEDSGRPVIGVWQHQNEAARTELLSLAKSLYWRRFLMTETQK